MAINCLIVGYGVVGHHLAKEIEALHPDIYDKYKTEFNTKRDIKYDILFVCVDTPYVDKNNVCDTTQVKKVIEDNDAELYVIKSTILPGTTEKLIEETDKRIVFSPEFYGGTQHCNNFTFNFTILGGYKEDCYAVQQILQDVYDARHSFRVVTPKTAELCKYMENCWLATKVSFCNEFYNIANRIDVNYEDLRELFILDPRNNASHTFVYREHPYWDSHCLNKDVPALAETYDSELLKAVIAFNEKQKRVSKLTLRLTKEPYDWEKVYSSITDNSLASYVDEFGHSFPCYGIITWKGKTYPVYTDDYGCQDFIVYHYTFEGKEYDYQITVRNMGGTLDWDYELDRMISTYEGK